MRLGALVLPKLARGRVTPELRMQGTGGSNIGLWHRGAAGARPALPACGARNSGRNQGSPSAAGGSGAGFLSAQ